MSTDNSESSSGKKRQTRPPDHTLDAFGSPVASDAELLAGIRAGDMRSCRLLVERYQRLLYSIAYGLVGDHSEADDAVQEVFIRFFEKAHRKVRKPGALKTYLARSTTNECIDRLRRMKRKPTVSLDGLEAVETIPFEDGRTPQEDMRRKELGELINWALGELSVRQRKVIILSLTEGLSYTEIAEVLECEEVTVRTHLHRARKRLQKLLGPRLRELEAGLIKRRKKGTKDV